jgi:hypothetical protein
LSEDGPPRLRKPENGANKRDTSSKLVKARADIKEKVGSFKLKKGESSITNKVNSLKTKKTVREINRNGSPTKLRIPKSDSQEKFRFEGFKENIPNILRQKRLMSIIGIVILIILVVSTAMWAMGDKKTITLPSNNTTQQVDTPKNHYNNGNISFDYPEGWNVSNSTEAPMIVTVAHDENNSFSVFKEDLGTQNFTYKVASWRSNILSNGMIYYEGDLTIDNTTAYELEANYKPADKVFTTRGIAFQKNNTAYFLIFVFDKALIDYKYEMDKVINSFHVN